MLAARVGAPCCRAFSTTRWMTRAPNVAIVGVTGAVGQELLKVIERRGFKFNNLKLLASGRSAGKTMTFQGQSVTVEELGEDSFRDMDIALFSAGGAQSKKFAPAAVKANCVVIDNSSAFRMDPKVPLVVPEVNPEAVKDHNGIIANPNCSTILMNVAVYPLHKAVGVTRCVISTYQAASGAGAEAMRELEQQARDWTAGKPLTKKIWKDDYMWNLFSHNSKMDVLSGYNEEELKMVNETRKIFADPRIMITATCIRVPVLRAHCESINLTLRGSLTADEARAILAKAPGCAVVDDRQNNHFPMPIDASGRDEVLVGRVREDLSQPKGKGIELFLSGDQLLKGAALNAVQIAELL